MARSDYLTAEQDFIVATYTVETPDLEAAAIALGRGQTVGNPTLISKWESPAVRAEHEAAVEIHAPHQLVVYFPIKNFGRQDGLNHLLSVLMGGQMDVGLLRGCVLEKLQIPQWYEDLHFRQPRYGIHGIRRWLGVPERPLLGGIVKPKLGLRPQQLGEVVREMAEAGCDFIKEDEVLGNIDYAPLGYRVTAVRRALKGLKRRVLFAPCVTADGHDLQQKIQTAMQDGATALHFNVWCGLGAFRWVADTYDIPLFFQKSGDRLWLTGPYRISESVWYQLIRLAGCDFAHVGMVGGYLNESVESVQQRLTAMHPTIPSFSCGMTPTLVKPIVEQFGANVMLSSGGYLHSHPRGIRAAGQEFHEAIADAISAPQPV